MTQATRIAGINGSATYRLDHAPAVAPDGTIYSDPARTVVAVPTAPLVATADPLAWTLSYPDTLAAGQYFLEFETDLDGGGVITTDVDDTLLLRSAVGTVADACPPNWVDPTALPCLPVSGWITAEQAVRIASEFLWLMTGRRFGPCDTVVRPNVCRTGCRCVGSGAFSTFDPLVVPHAGFACSCWSEGLDLLGPVHRVDQVVVDGAEVPADEYALYDPATLVRLDGSWPCCNRLRVTSGLGYFAIAYAQGEPVPPMGVAAATIFACELARIGSTDCKLPARVTQIVRQGVTQVLLDPFEFMEQGGTGLYLPDLFISTVNPLRQRAPISIGSPDSPRQSRVRA